MKAKQAVLPNLKDHYLNFVQRIKELGVDKNFYPHLTASHQKAPTLADFYSGKTLYEIYPRAFSEEGTLSAICRSLDKIQYLGIEVIWLMPVYPVGKLQRKGKLGSPYAVRDYFNIDPALGTLEDFKNLVKQAHQKGVRIILDLVVNHVAPDYQGFVEHPEMAMRDGQGKPTRKVAEWGDVVDLDYSHDVTSRHVLKIMSFWLQTGIDGFRCDVAGLVPVRFWDETLPGFREKYPAIYMLAEWQSPVLHRAAFNSGYDWVLYELILKVKQKKEKASHLLEWVKISQQAYPAGFSPLRFIENHDLPRAVEVFGTQGFLPFLVFIYCVNGIPLVYNGQEIGASLQPTLFDQEAIDWANGSEKIKGIYIQLIKLRKKLPALSAKELLVFHHNQEDNILVFKKEKLLIILNFSDHEKRLIVTPRLKQIIFAGTALFNTNHKIEFVANELVLTSFQATIIDTSERY